MWGVSPIVLAMTQAGQQWAFRAQCVWDSGAAPRYKVSGHPSVESHCSGPHQGPIPVASSSSLVAARHKCWMALLVSFTCTNKDGVLPCVFQVMMGAVHLYCQAATGNSGLIVI